MEHCNWFTVVELARYHTALAMWNLVWRKAPRTVYRKITVNEDMTLVTKTPRLQITRRWFRYRGVCQWNDLSQEVRCQKKLSVFKKDLKKWIILQRDAPAPDPDTSDMDTSDEIDPG